MAFTKNNITEKLLNNRIFRISYFIYEEYVAVYYGRHNTDILNQVIPQHLDPAVSF